MIYLACPFGVSPTCDPTAAKILHEYRYSMFRTAILMLQAHGPKMLAPCEFNPGPMICEAHLDIGEQEVGEIKWLKEISAVVVVELDGWTRAPWLRLAVVIAIKKNLPIFYLSSYEINDWVDEKKVSNLRRQPLKDISETI